MRVLAFDTALGAGSVALVDDGVCVARRIEPRPRALVERLIPMIEDCLAEASADYQSLDLIAATVGPGTFAGLRIGVAVARGLSLATGVPAAGVGSLEALARGALHKVADGGSVVAVIDGRRGQVYLQPFRNEAGALVALDDPAAVDVDEAAARLPEADGIIVGSGAPLIDATGALRVLSDETAIDAAAVAALAASRPIPRVPPRPLYLRAPDAKLPAGAVPG
jgi:tRNA threonylcarbamoyladenosine biosynthesis protein TsaB